MLGYPYKQKYEKILTSKKINHEKINRLTKKSFAEGNYLNISLQKIQHSRWMERIRDSSKLVSGGNQNQEPEPSAWLAPHHGEYFLPRAITVRSAITSQL